MDVIKQADHVIDLGPEGGHKGGEVLFSGTPEGLVNEPRSHTGQFLKAHLTATMTPAHAGNLDSVTQALRS